jgi:hypothetical protein
MWTEAARQAAAAARAAKSGGEQHTRALAQQHGIDTSHLGAGTYDRYGVTPHEGYMVGGAPPNSRYTGIWTDPQTGKRYVEKSTRVNSAPLARSLGRRRNQIAVWNLAAGREIPTGGTGT